ELSFVPAEAQVAAQHFPAVEIANGNQLSQQALALGAHSYCKKRSKHTFHPLAMASGRRFKLYVEMLGYSEMEVRRILKAHSPYISLHDMRDIRATGAQARLIYEAKRA